LSTSLCDNYLNFLQLSLEIAFARFKLSFDDASLREGFVPACVYLNADHGKVSSEIGPGAI
jgi:hypothetical protein